MIRYTLPLASLLVLGPAAVLPASAQDVAAGGRVFNQCRACHTINAGGRAGVGPNLHGAIGRKTASAEGFRYSPAMREKGASGHTWTEENLRLYLQNPREVVPGTTMSYPGLKNEQQLNDLIAYLKSQS